MMKEERAHALIEGGPSVCKVSIGVGEWRREVRFLRGGALVL
jgi:hypothetical protein